MNPNSGQIFRYVLRALLLVCVGFILLLIIRREHLPTSVNTTFLGNKPLFADHMTYWVENHPVSITGLLTGHYDTEFSDYNQRSLNYGDKNIWFRFTLENTDSRPAKWFLNLESALLFDVELFQRKPDGSVLRQVTGLKYTAAESAINHNYFVFPIEQPGGSQTYYLRVNTPFYVYFSPTLNNVSTFLKDTSLDTSLTFFFTGLLAGVFLYVIVLLLEIGFEAYVMDFAIFTLLALFMILYMNGFLMQFLHDSVWLKTHLWLFLHASLQIAYLLVTQHYLQTKKHYPRIHQYLNFSMAFVALCLMLVPTLSYPTLITVQLFFVGHLVLVLTVISLYIRAVEGPRVTLFVIGNIGLLLAAAVATLVAAMNVRGGAWITKHGSAIGFCWQALFFTWALSQQISQLRIEKNRLAAESKAKSDFIAKMSHEIRTPLNGVLGMTQVLQSTIITDEQKNYLNVIESSGKTLLTVINDILDYSKLTAGKVGLSPHPFNLEKLLAELNTLFGELAHPKKIYFNIIIAPETPAQIYGDSVRLRQVLTNLLSNAFKFTDKGTIILNVKPLIPDVDSLSNPGEKVILQFSIQDTGIGISQADQKKLFENFSQIDTSLSRSHGGVGLGLSISKQLIEMMGGSISLNSTLTQGSEFIFTVPFHKQTPGTAYAQVCEPGQKPAQQNRKILVAEDNEINRNVIAGYLEKMGIQADFVENGRQAVEKVASQPTNGYKLILMDSEMPVMDGLSACKKIRVQEKRGGRKPVAIIALTAHASETHRDACLKAGMNDCIGKPIVYNQLHTTIEKWSGGT